jgi:HNH endonuclease
MRREIRHFVRDRAKDCCEYCGTPAWFTSDDFAVEHISPSSRGGSDETDNYAWSCSGCNSRKFTAQQGRDPVTGEMAPLYNPRLDIWEEHFLWSDDKRLFIGKTPTGRATIVRIKINREGVANLREVLCETERHPWLAESSGRDGV